MLLRTRTTLRNMSLLRKDYLSKTEIDVKERVQELIHIINRYRERAKSSPGDTDVVIKNWGFNVAKQERDYTVGMELNLTLTPKPKKAGKSNK